MNTCSAYRLFVCAVFRVKENIVFVYSQNFVIYCMKSGINSVEFVHETKLPFLLTLFDRSDLYGDYVRIRAVLDG